MPPAFHPPASAPPASATIIAVEIIARPAPRKAPMSSIPKKPTKGGGKAKRAPKKRGRKKKEKAEEVESSGESVIVSDIKEVTVVEDSDNESADDGGSSAGGESDVSEYKDTSYVIVRRPTSKGKGVSSKTSSGKNTTTVSGGSARKGSAGKGSTGRGSAGKGSAGKGSAGKESAGKGSAGKGSARKGSARKSAVDKSPKKRDKSTPGKKGRAMVGNTAEENSNLLDDTEDGYYPDDENDENYLETSKTPAKRAAKKATGGSVGKGTPSKTTRKTSAGRKTPTKATVGVTTRSSLRKALMGLEGEGEQEENKRNLLKEPQMTTAKKRKAPSPEDNRLKKVAKTGSAKNVGVVRAGLESLSLGGADDDAGEAGGSKGQSSGKRNTGYIIKGGTSEQRAAIIAANDQGRSVLQSEPVVGKKRLSYGGKSVARLQELWEMGPPEYDSK